VKTGANGRLRLKNMGKQAKLKKKKGKSVVIVQSEGDHTIGPGHSGGTKPRFS